MLRELASAAILAVRRFSRTGILHQARLAQRHTLRTCLGEEASRSSCWHGLPRQAIVDVCADCLHEAKFATKARMTRKLKRDQMSKDKSKRTPR